MNGPEQLLRLQPAISFVLNNTIVRIDFRDSPWSPTTTLLNFLRGSPQHKGVKEGCAEGDCGACTTVLGEVGSDGRMHYRSVDSCLVFLPMVHGKMIVTVEDLKSEPEKLHPVQQAMVERDGSQCGFCTPGFIMSMFALYKNQIRPSRAAIDDALTGNLCRCTGYRPIVEAAAEACVHDGRDQFSDGEAHTVALLKSIPHSSVHLQTESQRYYQPTTLGEALSLKHRIPQAILLNGATDVALRVTKRHELLADIIDLSGIPALREIRADDKLVSVGAGASLTEVFLAAGEQLPALRSVLEVFGSLQIRNLATMGGNLGSASPIGDLLPLLIAYGATVVLESIGGAHEVQIDQFITGYRSSVRREDEVITTIRIPKPLNGTTVRSYKISRRKDLDISTVSAAFRLELDPDEHVSSSILAYGGMADRARRASSIEQALKGKPWTRATIENVSPLFQTEFSPISDARGGAAMRSLAASNLLLKFWSDTKGHL